MNFIRVIFAALLGLLSTSVFVFAEESNESSAATISTESSLKQYVVTFHDEVSAEDFSEVSKWITENKGEIVESINENFAKLIIAKSDPSIRKFYSINLISFLYFIFSFS